MKLVLMTKISPASRTLRKITLLFYFLLIPRPFNQSYPMIILDPPLCVRPFPSTAPYSVTTQTPSDILRIGSKTGKSSYGILR